MGKKDKTLMKHFLLRFGRHALLLAVMLCFCSGIWAETGNKTVYYTPSGEFLSNDVYYPDKEGSKPCVGYEIDSSTGVVSKISFNWGDSSAPSNTFATVTIPDEIEGIKVKKIAPYASNYCDGLEKMVFPKYLNEVGHHMIAGEKGNDGNYKQFGVATLATVDFSKVENFADLTIADDAFVGCTALLTGDDGKFIYSGYDKEYAGGGPTGVTYTICPKTHAMRVTDFASCTQVLRIDGSRKVNNEIQGTDCRLNGMLKNAIDGVNGNKNQVNVKQIIISEGLTTLGDNEFEGCTYLEYLMLPKSCDFNNFASAEDKARCGANIFKGAVSLRWVLAFSCGVPYRFTSSGSWTATVDYGNSPDGKYDVVTGEYNRTPQAGGDLKFYPTIEFVKGCKATFTAIPADAFAGNTNITSVQIGGTPDDASQIASVGANAFKGCTAMTKFDMTSLPNQSITFGTSCFEGCTGLTEMDFATRFIAEDNTTGLQLPAGFLKGCNNIKQLSFGNDIAESKIGDDAVTDDTDNALRVVNFVKENGTLTAYYTWFYYYKTSEDEKNFNLDDFTVNGEHNIEYGNTPAKYVVLKKVVDNGSSDWHQDNIKIENRISFYDKGKISGSLHSICDGCFANAESLREITIPQYTRKNYSSGINFFNTSVLEKLTLTNDGDITIIATRPDGATDSKEMEACYYNQGDYISGEEWPLETSENVSNVKYFITKLDDNFGTKATNVKKFSIVYNDLPTTFDQTMTIGANAFSGCTTLKRIDLGKYVTAIGANAFNGCTGMPSLVVDWKNLTTVGDGAFGGCTNIKAFVYDFNVIETRTAGDAYDKVIYNVYGDNIKSGVTLYAVYSGIATDIVSTVNNSNYKNQFYHASDYRYLPTKNPYDGSELATGYGTICLPYDISREKSYNLEGVYKAQLNADGTAVNLDHQTSDEIKAGVPYIFKHNATDENNLVVFASSNYYVRVSDPVDSGDNILTGTFSATKAEAGDYVMQSDNNFHIVGAYKPTIGAYRAYIQASSLPASTSMAAMFSLNIGGSVTGIGGINGDSNAATQKIYTIDGQRVLAPVKGQIYIIGGKKIVY